MPACAQDLTGQRDQKWLGQRRPGKTDDLAARDAGAMANHELGETLQAGILHGISGRLKKRGTLAKINRAVLLRSLPEQQMRHVLSALVQNQPGVLAHVSGMLASRGFNIDSLAVGATEDQNLSRMTFVVRGDDAELEQVRKQLDKLVTVVKVQDISTQDFVERDLMLLKVKANAQQRMEIVLLVEMFRARVVDVSPADLMIEISGQERKIEAFIELMRPYGIQELARTGRIALVRGRPGGGDVL
jgi:acetolactate synthase-1/3 small subunit